MAVNVRRLLRTFLFTPRKPKSGGKSNMGEEGQAVTKLHEIFKGRFPVVCLKINKQ